MSSPENNAGRKMIENLFDTIEDTIFYSMSPEGMVRNGAAEVISFDEPMRTTHGNFPKGYSYLRGCRP